MLPSGRIALLALAVVPAVRMRRRRYRDLVVPYLPAVARGPTTMLDMLVVDDTRSGVDRVSRSA